jgi:tetratricopeptide (TPR) repeat protein
MFRDLRSEVTLTTRIKGLRVVSCSIVVCCLIQASQARATDDYAELFRQAAAYASSGKYEKAITAYKAALAIRPGAPEALNNLAVVYYEAHKYAEALDIASKIWESHNELPSAALICGLAAVQCNRPKDAIAPLQALLSSDPSNRDALLGLASAHFALNELSEAIEIYQRETSLSPKDSQAWYGLAVCYERMAEDASRRLSEMPGGAAYSKRLLGDYFQSAGDAKLAAEAFGESATESSSPAAERQYEIARDLAGKSRNAFEQFVALAPDSWQTAVFLGDVERQHGRLAQALAHYRKAADLQPGNPGATLGLGTVYWEMGDLDHATLLLHEILKMNPESPQALFELANIAVRKRQNAEAIPLLKQYLALQPDALAARADLGRAYYHSGKYEEARIELQKAAVSDEQGDVHYQLSLALRKLGRTAEADAALKRSVEIREARLKREQRLHSDQ